MRVILLIAALLLGSSVALAQAERRDQDGSEGTGRNILSGPEITTAAANGELHTVRAELSRGTSPNTRTASGLTGLMIGARQGHVAIVRLFIRSKAHLDAFDPQRNTALHYAARYNRFEAAEALLKAGARPDPIDKLGTTPLMQAAKNGNLETLDVLLRHGANPEATDYTGKTALDLARDMRRTNVVRRLRGVKRR